VNTQELSSHPIWLWVRKGLVLVRADLNFHWEQRDPSPLLCVRHSWLGSCRSF